MGGGHIQSSILILLWRTHFSFAPLVPIPMYKTHFYLCWWGVGRGNSTQDLAIEREEEESGERRGGGEKVEKRTKGGGSTLNHGRSMKHFFSKVWYSVTEISLQ